MFGIRKVKKKIISLTKNHSRIYNQFYDLERKVVKLEGILYINDNPYKYDVGFKKKKFIIIGRRICNETLTCGTTGTSFSSGGHPCKYYNIVNIETEERLLLNEDHLIQRLNHINTK